MVEITPEKGPQLSAAPEAAPSRVIQPHKRTDELQGFLDQLGSISETAPARAGENLPAASGGQQAAASTGQAGQAQPARSWRDDAIAQMPQDDRVLQREIAKHIQTEVKKLRKEARKIARVSGAGNAYHLNILYSKIHRMSAMLASLLEAGTDMLKKLYIRIFVDKQPIL